MAARIPILISVVVSLLVAICFVVFARARIETFKYAGLPVMSEAALRRAPFDWLLFVRHSAYLKEFAGRNLVQVTEYEGKVGVMPGIADGQGLPLIVGPIDQKTGRFRADLSPASGKYPYFDRVEGVLHGPGLVNGAPCVYVEMRSEWAGIYERAHPHFRSIGWSGVFRSCREVSVMP